MLFIHSRSLTVTNYTLLSLLYYNKLNVYLDYKETYIILWCVFCYGDGVFIIFCLFILFIFSFSKHNTNTLKFRQITIYYISIFLLTYGFQKYLCWHKFFSFFLCWYVRSFYSKIRIINISFLILMQFKKEEN